MRTATLRALSVVFFMASALTGCSTLPAPSGGERSGYICRSDGTLQSQLEAAKRSGKDLTAADVLRKECGPASTKAEYSKRSVIVFVHGLGGDSIQTWFSEQGNGETWPHLLRQENDALLDDFDVYSYGYQSGPIGGQPYVMNVAAEMTKKLIGDGVFDHREIFFVAHSLGGIVTRSAILQQMSRYEKKTRLVTYLGTPGNGSFLAFLIPSILKSPQAELLVPINPDSLLPFQQGQWRQIIKEERADLPIVSCICEGQPLRALQPLLSVPVVTKKSCLSMCFDLPPKKNKSDTCDPEASFPLGFPCEAQDKDHLELVKPDSENSPIYSQVKAWILNHHTKSTAQGSQVPGEPIIKSIGPRPPNCVDDVAKQTIDIVDIDKHPTNVCPNSVIELETSNPDLLVAIADNGHMKPLDTSNRACTDQGESCRAFLHDVKSAGDVYFMERKAESNLKFREQSLTINFSIRKDSGPSPKVVKAPQRKCDTYRDATRKYLKVLCPDPNGSRVFVRVAEKAFKGGQVRGIDPKTIYVLASWARDRGLNALVRGYSTKEALNCSRWSQIVIRERRLTQQNFANCGDLELKSNDANKLLAAARAQYAKYQYDEALKALVGGSAGQFAKSVGCGYGYADKVLDSLGSRGVLFEFSESEFDREPDCGVFVSD